MPLVRGNKKLGGVWHWSLPTGSSCPGLSDECKRHCYNHFVNNLYMNAKATRELNKRISDSHCFVNWMLTELMIRRVRVLRIHTDGDFYDADYVRKWTDVARSSPSVTFYAYTRSWRIPNIEAELVKFSALANVWLWYSTDRAMPQPTNVPPRVRLAYMQVSEQDTPDYNVDLVFRIVALRKRITKWLHTKSGKRTLVCPAENGITTMSCERCRLCFRDTSKTVFPTGTGRVALPLVA